MSLDDGFERLLGRSVKDEERERLYQVKEVLGIGTNDALWLVLLALQYHDTLYREYPQKIGDELSKSLSEARESVRKMVKAEVARAQGLLAEAVMKVARSGKGRLATTRLWLGAALVVLFGGFCVASGFSLARGAPTWAAGRAGVGRAVAGLLGAPAGWMAFALVLPIAVHWARAGWTIARREDAATRERRMGWLMLGMAVAGIVACLGMLVRVVG